MSRIPTIKDYLNGIPGKSVNPLTTPIVKDRDNLTPIVDKSILNNRSGADLYVPQTTVDTPVVTTGTTTPTTTGATDTTGMWDMYRNQLQIANVNQKAELAAINQKANSYVNNYLKALGLSGTSAGASQIAENNVNLMNAYAQANADYQNRLNEINENERAEIEAQEKEDADALAEQKNTYGAYLASALETAAKSGATSKRMNEIMNMYDDENLPEGLKQSLMAAYGDALKWETDRDTVLKGMQDSIEDVYEDLSTKQLDQLENIMDKLSDAKTEEEYDSLYEQYKKIIQNPKKADNNYTTTTTDAVKAGAIKSTEASDSASGVSSTADVSDFGALSKSKNKENQAWVYALQKAAQNGDIPNGTLINMTFGTNVDKGNIYEYRDGKWYSKPDANKNVAYSLDEFDGNLVNHIKILLNTITGKRDYEKIIDTFKA